MSRQIQFYGSDDNRRFFGSKNLELMRRKGLRYVGKKAFYQYVFWHLYPLFKPKTFSYEGRELPYFNHRYNNAHANERTVEVAVALELLKFSQSKQKQILEVGNVLSHYVDDVTWDIVDKFEPGINVVNCDILDYKSEKRFDLILCISTIEHIGFDEKPEDNSKCLKALNKMVESLSDDGCLFYTFPLGWNPHLDQYYTSDLLPLTHSSLYKRMNWKNIWQRQSDIPKAPHGFGTYIGADHLVICKVDASHQ